jgi:hypothetical protein
MILRQLGAAIAMIKSILAIADSPLSLNPLWGGHLACPVCLQDHRTGKMPIPQILHLGRWGLLLQFSKQ